MDSCILCTGDCLRMCAWMRQYEDDDGDDENDDDYEEED